MDEIRWRLIRINWTLYHDDSGLWMAFNSASESHQTMDKENMESWLKAKGLRTTVIETLFRDAAKNGETTITVSKFHEPPD